ncbi:MAG: hypothetical protein KGI71_04815 [Patescibacteria group bacterium]|nr:hypothetical protein [Patescibacteria group bacterium]
MTPAEVAKLRARVKAAIDADGIGEVAARVQCQPPTLWRFVSGAGRTNRGTLLQIAEGMKKR